MKNCIQGENRLQIVLIPDCLEHIVGIDNEVRVIEAFAEALDIEKMGFEVKNKQEGRPCYHPKDLLKLFIYGYLNGVRSSRKLEKECQRNIELMWLMKKLAPDHNTIANFRKDNSDFIRNVFQATVSMAKHFSLIGGMLLAGDSTKLRAQNSKKNNYNAKKIERHLEYIDTKLSEYQEALSQADGDTKIIESIQSKIETQKSRKSFYKGLSETLEQTGESQISTTDPDSRQLITRNNITEVAYSVQTTVDAQHNIPIDYLVTNQNDSKAMGEMVERTKQIIDNKDITILYDKGYHTGSEIKKAEELGINVLVAIPSVASHAPETSYDIEHFTYDKENDHYVCPENQILSTNKREYQKQHSPKNIVKVKHYKTDKCHSCPVFVQCTKNQKGRLIERSEYTEYVERNRQRIDQNQALYKRRQAIVEHPYGIIKRQWGFNYIMTKKGIEKASSDVGFIFVAYNLRRIINLLDPQVFKEYLNRLLLNFFNKIDQKLAILSQNILSCNFNIISIFVIKEHYIPLNSPCLC